MRYTRSRHLIVLCAAALVGVALGYVDEAGAGDRGIVVSGGGSRQTVDGGRPDRTERRRPDRAERAGRERMITVSRPARRERGDERDRYAEEGYRGGYRPLERPDTIYETRGSFITAHNEDDQFALVDDGTILFDTLDNLRDNRAPYLYDPYGVGADRRPSFPSEPKFIDIDAERLDRRPIGPTGIDVVYTGGAKIIRIAPRDAAASRRTAGVVNTPERARSTLFQPWSSGWLKHCSEAYGSFDPDLGTYVARDGSVRFCTGE